MTSRMLRNSMLALIGIAICGAPSWAIHGMVAIAFICEIIDEFLLKGKKRKKGSWIDHSFETYDKETGYYRECSACHETFTEVNVREKPSHYNYCPKCGAEMWEGA